MVDVLYWVAVFVLCFLWVYVVADRLLASRERRVRLDLKQAMRQTRSYL